MTDRRNSPPLPSPDMGLDTPEVAVIPPGHDAWTVGDEPCGVIDWQGFADYAKG